MSKFQVEATMSQVMLFAGTNFRPFSGRVQLFLEFYQGVLYISVTDGNKTAHSASVQQIKQSLDAGARNAITQWLSPVVEDWKRDRAQELQEFSSEVYELDFAQKMNVLSAFV